MFVLEPEMFAIQGVNVLKEFTFELMLIKIFQRYIIIHRICPLITRTFIIKFITFVFLLAVRVIRIKSQ